MSKGGPSVAKPLPFWAKASVGGKTTETSLPDKKVKGYSSAPIRKTFVPGSGTQIRSKFGGTQQSIKHQAGQTVTTSEKRAHSQISGERNKTSNSSSADGTPKLKKKRLEDPRKFITPAVSKPSQAQPLGTMPHFNTATQLAEFIFKSDAENGVLPRHVKLRVSSILTVPGVTMDVYLNRLASSPEFKTVTQKALKIFRGQLPIDEITVMAFIIANPKRLNKRRDGCPEADIWYKAQLQMGLEANEIRSWENNPIFRAYRRVLRYLQQCGTGRLRFESELGLGLLQDAREISRMPTKNACETTEMTTDSAEKQIREPPLGFPGTSDSRVEVSESIKDQADLGAKVDKAVTHDIQSRIQEPL
ncbi:hypothetical protein GCG54_00008252 [Colletotrichum gloeosporioides]|uniref:Uncharacterized protein n=1 Tax=Colletotrichum gloeosporioides TaxID=474922 RepID=A0A8H4C7B9_COLGL|nr:uncharacterized protein GCG54_00008252 [Colletotrichum gloeosporioides]KAF3798795.1 hypothetical protein GCG54_00008252 [Colletotrichum gloeosporioides]